MKNKITKSLFCIIILFCMTTVVYAGPGNGLSTEEGNNSMNADITVGNVAVPVYSVNIEWKSLTFDWVYDDAKRAFDWNPEPVCEHFYSNNEIAIKDAIMRGINLYKDSTCSIKADTYDESITDYYYFVERENATIYIRDFSKNGEIIPSIEWKPSEKYKNVIANLGYVNYSKPVCLGIDNEYVLNYAVQNDVTLYSESSCLIESDDNEIVYEANKYYAFVNIEANEKLIDGEVPDEARYPAAGEIFDHRFTELEQRAYEAESSWLKKDQYLLTFDIESDSEKEAVTPNQTDIIGNITISIRAR